METIGKSAGTLFITVLALDRCIEDIRYIVKEYWQMQIRGVMSTNVVAALPKLAHGTQLHHYHLGGCVLSRRAYVRLWYDEKEEREKVRVLH